jgi:hypothetical protein
MDNNNMNNELQFIDYPPELIQAKLKLCINYEAKYGQSNTVNAWRKWCNSYEYRKNEWRFRQNVAKSLQYGV